MSKPATLIGMLVIGFLLGWVLFGRGKPPVVSSGTSAIEDTLARSRAESEALRRWAHDTTAVLLHRIDRDSLALATRDRSAQVHHAAADTALAHHDTVTAYVERTGEAVQLRLAFDTAKYDLHLAHRALVLDSLALRDAAVRDRQQSDVIDGLNLTISRSRQPSRWTLGLTAGWTVVASGGSVYTGPGLTAGLSRSFRFPCLLHCASP